MPNGISNEYHRSNDIIIYIRNVFSKQDIANFFRNNAAVEGSDGINIDKRVQRFSNIVFDKNKPDAFSNKQFEQYLIDNKINELAITGVFADQCVYWTALSALNRNYQVNLVQNGVAAKSKAAIIKAAKSLESKGAKLIVYKSLN